MAGWRFWGWGMRGLGKGKGGRVWERERGMVVMVFGREMNRLEWGFLGWVGGWDFMFR